MKTSLAVLRCSLILAGFMLMAGRQDMNAQVRVTKVADQAALSGKKGIVYSLPRTRIHISLLVKKTENFAGPLAEYAKSMAGLAHVIDKNTVSYSIEDVSVFTTTEPDPGQVYLLEKEEKSQNEVWISFGKTAPVMTLERFDKSSHPAGFSSWNNNLFIAPEQDGLFRKYTDSPTREIVDTIIRKVSIDTVVLVDKIFKRSMVDFSDEEKAQEAAAKIRQIEQDQYNLLIGYQETAYSIESLRFMYEKLEEQRQEYLKLFAGVSVEEVILFDLPVVPDATMEEQAYPVAGFSKTVGLTTAEGQNAIQLKLKQDDASVLNPGKGDGPSGPGIVYRAPGKVNAVVTFQGKELISLQLDVLQLGALLSLPPDFKRVEFDMETGGLKTVVLE